MSFNKLQNLLVKHLQKHGFVKLLLPDGVVLEIGINQLDDMGELKPAEDYCWVMASRQDKVAVLDSYNLGVRFSEKSNAIVYEDKFVDNEGNHLCRLDVI